MKYKKKKKMEIFPNYKSSKHPAYAPTATELLKCCNCCACAAAAAYEHEQRKVIYFATKLIILKFLDFFSFGVLLLDANFVEAILDDHVHGHNLLFSYLESVLTVHSSDSFAVKIKTFVMTFEPFKSH